MQQNYPDTILYDFEPGDVVTIHRTWGDKGGLSEGFKERFVANDDGLTREALWARTR